MKQLTILVPDGHHNLSSVVGTYELFTKANEYFENSGRRPVFSVQLASTSKEVRVYGGLFSIHVHHNIASITRTDLIIIPAVRPDFLKSIAQVEELMAWLLAMQAKGAEIASICTGAFLLASTGLLDNRTCSTHWMSVDAFEEMYPQVNLSPDQLITDENGIYTNGGAFSFLNLLLYLVEKYYDRPTAIFCSKVFQVDINRHSQSPFFIFSTQKNHSDEIVKSAQEYIEQNMNERISIEELSSRFSVSRRNFDRRFIRATGNTPQEYAQRVKVEAAKKAFESTLKTVSEVMYEVGYSDPKAFRDVFRKITGISPLEYRDRYNKEAEIGIN